MASMRLLAPLIFIFIYSAATQAGPAYYKSRSNAYLACERCQIPIEENSSGIDYPVANCSIRYGSIRNFEGDAKADAMHQAAGLVGAYVCAGVGSTRYFYYGEPQDCVSDETGRCDPPPKPPRCPEPTTHNPIKTLSGIKVERVVDYTHPKNEALSLVRTYTSAAGNDLFPGKVGYGKWFFSFQPSLIVYDTAFADLIQTDGSIIETFRPDKYGFSGNSDLSGPPLTYLSENSGSRVCSGQLKLANLL